MRAPDWPKGCADRNGNSAQYCHSSEETFLCAVCRVPLKILNIVKLPAVSSCVKGIASTPDS